MEYTRSDIRDFIVREIYIKTGLQGYKSKYLDDLVLLHIDNYEISISINYEKKYIQIDVIDYYLRTTNIYKEPYNTYNDILDIIDDVFKYIKPSKLY
jgi:hypothetical protein